MEQSDKIKNSIGNTNTQNILFDLINKYSISNDILNIIINAINQNAHDKDEEISNLWEDIYNSNNENQDLQNEIDDLQDEIDDLQSEQEESYDMDQHEYIQEEFDDPEIQDKLIDLADEFCISDEALDATIDILDTVYTKKNEEISDLKMKVKFLQDDVYNLQYENSYLDMEATNYRAKYGSL